MRDSVTVSIAALINGILSRILVVTRVVTSTFLGKTSLAAGIRNILYFFALTYLTTWVGIVTTAEGESYHYFSFTAGPPLLFLGATAGYLLLRRLLWKKLQP